MLLKILPITCIRRGIWLIKYEFSRLLKQLITLNYKKVALFLFLYIRKQSRSWELIY